MRRHDALDLLAILFSRAIFGSAVGNGAYVASHYAELLLFQAGDVSPVLAADVVDVIDVLRRLFVEGLLFCWSTLGLDEIGVELWLVRNIKGCKWLVAIKQQFSLGPLRSLGHRLE